MVAGSTAIRPALIRDEARTLLGRTMGLVALTAGAFALGAYLGRNVAHQWGWLFFIGSLVCLIGLNGAAQRSEQAAIPLLFGFGVLTGLALAPTLAYYVSADPQAVWQAGAATALFVGGFGAAGYATRRDLSALARGLFWALLALIAFGIVTIFVQIPNGALIYADRWSRHLRRASRIRFPTPAAKQGHQDGTASSHLHLPRRPQRVPAAAVPLQR